MDIITLSNYVVNQFSQQSPDGITPMKLQKLLYYIKVWTTVAEQELVSADFEHWRYGPVNKAVYDYYKEYGKGVIAPNHLDDIDIKEPETELVDFIVENYIKFDAFTLSSMTHMEEPWKKTPDNKVISNNLIKSYYSKQYFSKNFKPFNLSNKEFYPLNNHSFTLDMAEEDAEEITKYSSYQAYKDALREAENEFNAQWLDFVIN